MTTPEGLLFSTPTDTLQALYVYRKQQQLIVSNSLHLLLRVSGASLRPSYLLYDVDLMTVMFGLSAYRRTIPTSRGSIALYYHCNLLVGPDLSTSAHQKPLPPTFPDFEAYRSFLCASVERLVANAAADERRTQFKPLATVSTGYDSPACAAVARTVGCRTAFTFTKARSEFSDPDDSGREIGELLELQVSEVEPTAYMGRTDLPECEFVAGGVGADSVVFASAEPLLPGKMGSQGFHGDRIWDRNGKVSADIVRGDASGGGLTEFRLRVGFVNAALPFFGCTRHAEIHAVSNSPEMAAWSVPNPYDRPIPRRIVEDAGIPREAFGISKKAVAKPYLRTDGRGDVRECLSERSEQAFHSFLEGANEGRSIASALRRYRYTMPLAARAAHSHKVSVLERALGRHWFSSPAQRWRYSQRLSRDSALFYWASTVIASRYASAPTSESI